MNDEDFNKGETIEPFLKENLKNYYFRKRYQRYDPPKNVLDAIINIAMKRNIVVATTKKCPYCIATIPLILRIYLEADNPNLGIRLFEEDVFLPKDFDKEEQMPQLIMFDENFNSKLKLDYKDMKYNLENIFIEKISRL